jgi:hypothetical protein
MSVHLPLAGPLKYTALLKARLKSIYIELPTDLSQSTSVNFTST